MKANSDEVAAKIVTLPGEFHRLGNVSILSLLQATGYFEFHDQIAEEDIREALIRFPERVEEWIQYSEDKRTSSGWYVIQNDEGLYETGYISDACTPTKRVQYENVVDACASFIKHEIEDIRLGSYRP